MADMVRAGSSGQSEVRSLVFTATVQRWGLLGVRLGPVQHIDVRLTLVEGAPCRRERVDGRPLGNLAKLCPDQFGEAENRLAHACRDSRSTTSKHLANTANPPRPATETFQRKSTTLPAAPAAEPELAPTAATSDPALVKQSPSTAIFRCDRKDITDRITRLRTRFSDASTATTPATGTAKPPHAVAVPPLAERTPREDRAKAVADLAALRERSFKEQGLHPSDMALQPISDDDKPDAKRASSVFRCDKEAISDRIVRLKVKPSETAGVPKATTPRDDGAK